jgi:hypothetical protein
MKGTQMQTAHDKGTTLEALHVGQPFRFYFRGEAAMGLKAQFDYGSGSEAALVLTSTESGLKSGALLSSFDVGNVVELAGAEITPSTKPGTVTPGANHFAEPAEIELHDGRLFFVSRPHDNGLKYRVDLQSGTITRATGAAPIEIYSEWSVVRGDDVLYQHQPQPEQGVSVTVAVEN